MQKQYDEAIVCGRFQPFHNDHLRYILASLGKCRFLWIGIAKPFRRIDAQSQSHREQMESNPFTYLQRLRMIRTSLAECGVPSDTYCIIPFDFEDSQLLRESDPGCDVVLMTRTDGWSHEKQRKIESLGKEVEVLYEELNPAITGSLIRTKMREGDESWNLMVPPAVTRVIHCSNSNG